MSNSAFPCTVAHQASLSMGFSRQEYWSGLPFPPLGDLFWPRYWTRVSCISCIGRQTLHHWAAWKVPYWRESESEVAESCPTLCTSVDCSLPGSSVHGVFQAGVLECAAIAFSRRSGEGSILTQGLNPGLLHCRQILHHLSHHHYDWTPNSEASEKYTYFLTLKLKVKWKQLNLGREEYSVFFCLFVWLILFLV